MSLSSIALNFYNQYVTANCLSRVCEVVSFRVRKNSSATLKPERAAPVHNFNKTVLNETLKIYFYTAIISQHVIEAWVRAQRQSSRLNFFGKQSLIWEVGGQEYSQNRIKANLTLIYPLISTTLLFYSFRRLKAIPCRLTMNLSSDCH